jgi:HAD superfamily hydrolase (TIGR01509 family)
LSELHADPVTDYGALKAPVRNVVFDVGGVLVEWNPQQVLTQFYTDPALRRHVGSALFEGSDWIDFDRGTLSEADLLAALATRAGRPAPEMLDLFLALRDSLAPKPDTVRLLETLHGRGVPLFCLSNMSDSIYVHLAGLHDFWARFQGIVISGRIQLLKPERAIYDHLLTRYSLKAEETVFLDDVEANVLGARAAGLRAFQFRNAADAERQLEALLAPPTAAETRAPARILT